METQQQSAVALALSCAGLLSGQPQSTAFATVLAGPVFADLVAGLAKALGQTPASLMAAFGSADLESAFGAKPLEALVTDGSTLLQPLLVAAQQRLAQSESVEYLCFASACWLRYSMGFDSKGDTIVVADTLAQPLLQNRLVRWDHIDEMMAGYLAIDGLFPAALASDARFVNRLSYWLCVILANGMSTALHILAIECRDYSARNFSTFSTAAQHRSQA